MQILITGGAGFIGSTIVCACLDAGHTPIVIDDLSAGAPAMVDDRVAFYKGDIADERLVDTIVRENPDIFATVHCAAKIVAPDSVTQPLEYYDNNVGKAVALFRRMTERGFGRFLFSSSAAIYDPTSDGAVDESGSIRPSSPYATSKAMTEQVLQDAAAAGKLRAVSLRYFNPIGAEPQRRTGQRNAQPTHALASLIDAWLSKRPFMLNGVDWPTRDGTPIRDFVHVWDVALAHVAALEGFDTATASTPALALNVGTGRGTTIRELADIFSDVVGSRPEIVDGPRRAGDVVGCWADTSAITRAFGWQSTLSVPEAVKDAVEWELNRRGLK